MTCEMQGPELLDRLWACLPVELGEALRAIVGVADDRALALFVVGGAVRDGLRPGPVGSSLDLDALLDLDPLLDLDIAVEGDPGPLLAALAQQRGTRVVRHDRFGTATFVLGPAGGVLGPAGGALGPAGGRIDLARTRAERYVRPGALPQVSAASIEADLSRRDFSVNAMALGLNGRRRGELLDPFDGRGDLQRGLIRTLHDHSFADDPTRLIRACWYGARLEARFAPGMRAQALRSLGELGSISGDRFGEAWRRLLLDRAAPAALVRASGLGIPQAREGGWSVGPGLAGAFAGRADGGPTAFWALTGLSAGSEVVSSLAGRCGLTRGERRALEAGAELRALRRPLGRSGLAASGAAGLLRPFDATTLGAAAALWGGLAAERVERALGEWAGVRAPLDAAALAELGVEPGAAIGRWLEALRDAVIDGELPAGRRGAEPARRLVQAGLQSPRDRPSRRS